MWAPTTYAVFSANKKSPIASNVEMMVSVAQRSMSSMNTTTACTSSPSFSIRSCELGVEVRDGLEGALVLRSIGSRPSAVTPLASWPPLQPPPGSARRGCADAGGGAEDAPVVQPLADLVERPAGLLHQALIVFETLADGVDDGGHQRGLDVVVVLEAPGLNERR